MASAPVNHWKLGFFVVFVAGAAVVAVISVGECETRRAATTFYTAFDESVSGVGSGGRVSFRGVDVGVVSGVAIAPDHRHVEVRYDLRDDDLPRLGIAVTGSGSSARCQVPPDLRAEVGGGALTGMKSVALDVVDPDRSPAPPLPFPVASNYIPAAAGGLSGLEDSLAKAASGVPALVDAVVQASGHVDRVLAQLEDRRVPDKAAATLERADAALDALQATVRRFDRERVTEKASQGLDEVRAAVAKLDGVLGQLDGERGLIAGARRATDAFGQAGRGVAGSTRDLDEALDELRDAAGAIRMLAEDLDREPDMLLKGRPAAGAR